MFHKGHEHHGYDKPHHYFQASFVKLNRKFFTPMDLHILLEYVIKQQIQTWIDQHDLFLFPFIKVEYSRNFFFFNGTHREIVTDIEHLSMAPLEKLHTRKMLVEVYIRLYYK